MNDLSRFEQWIDRHVDQSDPGQSQRHDTGQFGLGQPGSDAVTFDKALPQQPCRQQANTMI